MAGHAIAAEAADGQTKPMGQTTPLDAPGAQYWPDGHVKAIPLLQKAPGAHATGADADAGQTVPSGQTVGLVAPNAQ